MMGWWKIQVQYLIPGLSCVNVRLFQSNSPVKIVNLFFFVKKKDKRKIKYNDDETVMTVTIVLNRCFKIDFPDF